MGGQILEKTCRFFTIRKKHVFESLPVPLIKKFKSAEHELGTGYRSAPDEQNELTTWHTNPPESCQKTAGSDPPFRLQKFSQRHNSLTVGCTTKSM